jgi:hexokinase
MTDSDLRGWLRLQHVDAGLYVADEIIDAFLDEMQIGLNGEGEGTLPMIPAYVGTEHDIPHGRPVVVIDAGGTNLRTGLAEFDDAGTISLSSFNKRPMFGIDETVSGEAFYDGLADAVAPLMDQADVIGFCFSYPALITPDYDGRLLRWTKEIKIPDVVGECVGAGLRRALSKRGHEGKRVVVLNDTVAALLAGMAQGQLFGASNYVGFILGTGTNTAYVERNTNILKVPGLSPDGAQVINVESGGFNRFARGPLDVKRDLESGNPDQQQFEKMISGVYMGPLALELFKAVLMEGAFSESGAAAIQAMSELSTIHIDNLLADEGRETGVLGTEAFTDRDRDVMRTIFEAVVDRAALLAAINIGVGIIKGGGGLDPEAPVCVNIDGSTYYKTTGMPAKVQAQLGAILSRRGIHCKCVHVDDAPVVGAAIAALTTYA